MTNEERAKSLALWATGTPNWAMTEWPRIVEKAIAAALDEAEERGRDPHDAAIDAAHEAAIRADERRKVYDEYEDYDASREFAEYLKHSGGEATAEHLRLAMRRICGLEEEGDD